MVISCEIDNDALLAETLSLDLGEMVGNVWLVRIPPGASRMGSMNELPFDLETPTHMLSVAYSFFMGRYPVTQKQYEAVMGANPSSFHDRPDLPVEKVTWFDEKRFCRRLTERAGRFVRLPS